MDRNEAIKVIKDNWPESRHQLSEALQTLIPEFQESEDERIRKELMDFIDNKTIDSDERRNRWFSYLEKYKPISFTPLEDTKVKRSLIQYISELNQDVVHLHPSIETCNEWIAWLEKQGEQKEINLVEILKHYPKETELYSPLYGKLWLAEVDEEHEIITCYKHPLSEGDVRAILEQEDTVSFYSNGTTGLPDFSISKDCMLFLYDSEKQGEQKLTWSKENSCYYDDICEILINLINSPKSNVNKDVVQKDLDWLMSVKESQLKPTWSEEDERNVHGICMYLMCSDSPEGYTDWINWLKSLKERMKGE